VRYANQTTGNRKTDGNGLLGNGISADSGFPANVRRRIILLSGHFSLENPTISSGFGIRRHPVYKVQKFHMGIDMPKTKGTAVYATGSGVVIRKGYNSGYGNFIEIRHAGGFRSFYAHLSKTMVSAGDSVRIGKYIACVGNSGLTTGSHLHYEIRKGNRFLNPAEWCCCLLGIILKEETL
jgi:murein DD-endopeptidase MepM/ murein hydrolase activator NlpD